MFIMNIQSFTLIDSFQFATKIRLAPKKWGFFHRNLTVLTWIQWLYTMSRTTKAKIPTGAVCVSIWQVNAINYFFLFGSRLIRCDRCFFSLNCMLCCCECHFLPLVFFFVCVLLACGFVYTAVSAAVECVRMNGGEFGRVQTEQRFLLPLKQCAVIS